MQRLVKFLSQILILAFLSPAAHAGSIMLTPASSGQSLNEQVELLEDKGAKLNIADMSDPAVQQRFTPAHGKASVGQSANPWWIKVTLSAAADAPKQWWLEIASVTLLDLQLYLPDGQGGWQMRQSGERVSFAEGRDYPHRRMLLRLPELSEQPLTLYLRTYDPAGNSFPLKVWQLDDLKSQISGENLLLGLIYGVTTALLLYNLFIFLALRDSAYFWYVVTTTGALLMILSMTGHGFEYLWPGSPVPAWLDRITLPSLWGLFACRFTQTLLQTRRYVRWAHLLLSMACAIYAAAIFMNLLGYRYQAAWVIALLSLPTIPAALGAALIRWRQGFLPAQLYLYGYGLVLASVGILLLRSTGVLQPTPWNAYLYPLAVAAETILFSFALAYRIQVLKQERADALQQADREKSARLSQLQESADGLQLAVDRRTAELKSANLLLSQQELELRHAAFHDALTDLPNRRYLIEQCESALRGARQSDENLALLLIDLDHFKPINDRHGHDAGDLLLQHIARRLREQVRGCDTVARLGGDEFAVLIGGADAQHYAEDVAKRLLAELPRPVDYAGHSLTVSISIGVAFYPQHAEQFADLYKAADQALYQAKSAGRSGYAAFEPSAV